MVVHPLKRQYQLHRKLNRKQGILNNYWVWFLHYGCNKINVIGMQFCFRQTPPTQAPVKQGTSSASSGDLATAKELKAAQEQISALSEQVL